MMKKITLISILFFLFFSIYAQDSTYTIVIHGGAGYLVKKDIHDLEEAFYREALDQAISAGADVLVKGGTSLDAVEKAITVMEDSRIFNAGRGAVKTTTGIVELDASLMDGKNLMSGAVCNVRTIKNPIKAAHLVMLKTKHVMLCGIGATDFAKQQGMEMVDSSYFSLNEMLDNDLPFKYIRESKYGTVGCVALDKFGNLAAGTSTGGVSNKLTGRVGDSPIIGASTYADNQFAAISCTGHGEFFIRYVVAYDVIALMNYKKMSLKKATDYEINKRLKTAGGRGGLIAVNRKGEIALLFNTEGMFRAFIKSDGTKKIEIFK